MSALTEGRHRGEFIISEANGYQSRDTGTLKSGQNLVAGSFLGRITNGGKLTQLNPSANDGSEVAAGLLFDNVDASGGDTECVIIARNAEVKDAAAAANLGVVWPSGITDPQKAQAKNELAALGIIIRS